MRRFGDPVIEVLAVVLGLLSAGVLIYGTAGGGPTMQIAPVALGLAALGLAVLGAKDIIRQAGLLLARKAESDTGTGSYTGKDNP